MHPQFPDGGKMSVHLDSLAIGDTIEAKGVCSILHFGCRGPESKQPAPTQAALCCGLLRCSCRHC